MSYEYGLGGLDEAKAYYQHPLLGPRLVELCNILLQLKTNNASIIFGYPDDLKLKSSMTLFYIATKEQIFKSVLDKYFDGELDKNTMEILNIPNTSN